jgi:deazaflavin-dependent oxidoreductase (nitroreductase family)
MSDFNAKVIEEYRSTAGKLGGGFAGAPILRLTTTVAKSGKQRTNPLAYLRDGDRVLVFGSKAGAPTNPDWYHNLLAHPDVTIEIDGETRPVRAVVIDGAERDELFARQKQAMPGFADYEAKTDRVIPVIALERR